MKKNRLLALSLALVLSLSLLTGCGGGGGGQAAPSEPAGGQQTEPAGQPAAGGVELTVVTSYGGDDGNRKNYENAVASFEAATGNTILDASATSNEEWKAKVLTDFQTGTEPDVLFFFTNADAQPFVSAGKVVDLETIRAAYPEYAGNMRDSMLAVASDGKNYAVPSSGFWENMFVNTKVLSDCGVAVPGPDYTWDQFLADCETIKGKGYTPIACSLFEVPHYWFEFCVMNNGTLAGQLDLPASADDAAGQKWCAALNDMKDLYERGYFPANTLTATDAETVQLFGDGDAAFLIDGSWKVNYFVENYPDSQFLMELWPQVHELHPELKFEMVNFDNTPENAREILANLGRNIDLVADIFDETMLALDQFYEQQLTQMDVVAERQRVAKALALHGNECNSA